MLIVEFLQVGEYSMQIAEKQARYLKDSLQVRLGGLAANLARIQSFADHNEHREVVLELIEESKYFIEWSAPEVALPFQADLVKYQLTMSLWQLRWNSIWNNQEQRRSVRHTAGKWAQKILIESGLINPQ